MSGPNAIEGARLDVLLIGDDDHREMRSLVGFLERCERFRLQRSQDVRGCLEAHHSTLTAPQLIVVLQRWPDEFPRSDVLSLITTFPIARLVCCFGAWCESDGRNGSHWPHAVRVAVRDAERRIGIELDVMGGMRSALPLTASRDEAFEFGHRENALTSESCGRVLLVSADESFRELLADQCRAHAWSIVHHSSETRPDVAVIDVEPFNETTIPMVARLCRTTVVIAVMTMPYPEDVERLQQAGVRHVLSRITAASELMRHVLEFATTHTALRADDS